MLIQFSVENFRSIKEEQTLSLVKNSAQEMEGNYFDSQALNTPKLLKSAVIYGANASGKSNLFKALSCMKAIVRDSFNKEPDEAIRVEAFALDAIRRIETTTFVITIVVKFPLESGEQQPVRIEYGFSLDQEQVYEEWLSAYPKGHEQAWFHRTYDDEIQDYDWKESNFFKGQKDIWKKSTRKDQLFLSTAVQLNSEQLKPIYDWFRQDLLVVGSHFMSSKLSQEWCKQGGVRKKQVLDLLKQADIDVEDIEIRKYEMPNSMNDGKMSDEARQSLEGIFTDFGLGVYFVHLDKQGKRIEINLQDESSGTQKLFEFAALIFSVLNNGQVLIVDEFNQNLHPDLVKFLVKIFNSSSNYNNAQLILTTHETSLLTKDLLRRDQIWFCEKDKTKATLLYPLTDFSPHKDRNNIETYYLSGRYGGKPILAKDFVFPENLDDGIEH